MTLILGAHLELVAIARTLWPVRRKQCVTHPCFNVCIFCAETSVLHVIITVQSKLISFADFTLLVIVVAPCDQDLFQSLHILCVWTDMALNCSLSGAFSHAKAILVLRKCRGVIVFDYQLFWENLCVYKIPKGCSVFVWWSDLWFASDTHCWRVKMIYWHYCHCRIPLHLAL